MTMLDVSVRLLTLSYDTLSPLSKTYKINEEPTTGGDATSEDTPPETEEINVAAAAETGEENKEETRETVEATVS